MLGLCKYKADGSPRWPLALRFIKGAIHSAILLPVVLHAAFAALIVYIDRYINGDLGLPTSIVSLCPHCRLKSWTD